MFAEANNKQYVCVLYQIPALIFVVQTQTLKSGPILHRSMVMIFILSRLESVCSESCYNCDAVRFSCCVFLWLKSLCQWVVTMKCSSAFADVNMQLSAALRRSSTQQHAAAINKVLYAVFVLWLHRGKMYFIGCEINSWRKHLDFLIF